MHFAGSADGAGRLHRFFAAKSAAQDDNTVGVYVKPLSSRFAPLLP
jgi:hypothetical protein